MSKQDFRGVSVAMVTPFTAEGNIDVNTLNTLVDWHIEQGTDVILAAGTTGESATLSHEEHHELMERVVQQVGGRIPVLCGAGSNSTQEAISLSRYAEKAGGSAILSVCPYYNKPTQEGLFQHFTAIADSVALPVILYNVPGRTGSNLAAETTLRLAEHPNIIGVKEASGDLDQIMTILHHRPADFVVLSGDDALTVPMIALGGDGVISVAANEVPAWMREMVHLALSGQIQDAREWHYRLLPLMKANFVETNPMPVKTAMGMMGLLESHFRSPMVDMQPTFKNLLKGVLEDLNLLPAGGE